MKRLLATALAMLGISVGSYASAQTPAPPATLAANTAEQPRPLAAPKVTIRTHRWIDWQVATIDGRYRRIENSVGTATSNHLQAKQALRAGLKFDPNGRYSVQTSVGTGSSFTGSWDNLGPGTGSPTWDLAVRHLYFSAAPVKGVEVQVGGLGVVRGEQTEITSFDNDAFMTGERLSVKRPRQLYLDEVSVTSGFLGDTTTPNVFRRFDRMDDHNYTQILGVKKFGSLVSVSADWTSLDGLSTLRQGVRLVTKSWLPVDTVRFEQYQRVEGTKDAGFAVTAERAVTKRVGVSAGFAEIDRRYGTLNSDRFGPGSRVFGEARFTVLPELTVSTYYGLAVDNDFAVSNKHRVDVVASYNVLKVLQRAGAW